MTEAVFWFGLFAICIGSAFISYLVATKEIDPGGGVTLMGIGSALVVIVLLGLQPKGNDPELIVQAMAPFGALGLVAAIAGVGGGWMVARS